MDEANEQAQRQAHVMAGSPKSSDILSDPVTGEAFETDETAPGYAWKNRRAVDEYDKMSEIILDRNFSLGRYIQFLATCRCLRCLEEFGDTVLDSLREDEAEYDPYAPLGLSIDTR